MAVVAPIVVEPVPPAVRAKATGFQNNCALNNLIPDIVHVMRHDEKEIDEKVRREVVKAFNDIWGTGLDWRGYSDLILGMKNHVRREILLGPVLRQTCTDVAVKAPGADGNWPELTADHANEVAKKYKIRVEEYITAEVAKRYADARRAKGAADPSAFINVAVDQIVDDTRPSGAGAKRTCKLINVGHHFEHHAGDPDAAAKHNVFYATGVRPTYDAHDPKQFAALKAVVGSAILHGPDAVEEAMLAFEVAHGLISTASTERSHRRGTSGTSVTGSKAPAFLEVLTPEARKNVKEHAEKASKLLSDAIGTESKLFGPLFAAIPTFLAGAIELFAQGTPLFMQLSDLFKQFMKAFAQPGDGLTDDEVAEFSQALAVGSEAADFAQYAGELAAAAGNAGKAAAKVLNIKVRDELQGNKQISPDRWVELIKDLHKNRLVAEASDCLRAREQDLLDKFAQVDDKDGSLVKKYRVCLEGETKTDIIGLTDARFATTTSVPESEKIKTYNFRDRLDLFKLFETAYQELIAKSDALRSHNEKLADYEREDTTDRKGDSEAVKLRKATLRVQIKVTKDEIEKCKEEINKRRTELMGAGGNKADVIFDLHKEERVKFIKEADERIANAKTEAEAARNKAVNEAEAARVNAFNARKKAAEDYGATDPGRLEDFTAPRPG